ncbi:MAG: DUF6132 family protein [Kiritimatiellae bacterium]|nr:DUF6132 family protein [Kiritimatiellia bacterium]
MSPALSKTLLGGVIGALVGFAMYKFVGCKTGTCPIVANPWSSILIYGLIGALAMSGR